MRIIYQCLKCGLIGEYETWGRDSHPSAPPENKQSLKALPHYFRKRKESK